MKNKKGNFKIFQMRQPAATVREHGENVSEKAKNKLQQYHYFISATSAVKCMN